MQANSKETNQELKIVTRYATAADTDGKEIHNVAKDFLHMQLTQDSFTIKLKLKQQNMTLELADTIDSSNRLSIFQRLN